MKKHNIQKFKCKNCGVIEDIYYDRKGYKCEKCEEFVSEVNKKQVSNCCNSKVKIGGKGDFRNTDKVETCYYVCDKCNMPCDAVEDWEKEFDKLFLITPEHNRIKNQNIINAGLKVTRVITDEEYVKKYEDYMPIKSFIKQLLSEKDKEIEELKKTFQKDRQFLFEEKEEEKDKIIKQHTKEINCLQLTNKQKEVLNYIIEYNKQNDFPPSLYEIKDKFKFKSHSTAQFHVNNLIKKCFLKKKSGIARGIKF